MLRKKLAAFLIAAMVLTTSVPAAFAADTLVDNTSVITSEVSTSSVETSTIDESSTSEDSESSDEATVNEEVATNGEEVISEGNEKEEVTSEQAITTEKENPSDGLKDQENQSTDDVKNKENKPTDELIDKEVQSTDDVKSQENELIVQEENEQNEEVSNLIVEVKSEAPVFDESKDSIMYHHLENLSVNIGARVASTEAEKAAKDYIKGVFENLEYATDVQPFTYSTKTVKNVDSNNVIAVKDGKSDKQIIIGAHYDSVNASTGASDNASGIAVMLGVAEKLKDVSTDYTIKFVAFGAEEVGLKGSKYFASQMTESDVKDTIAMINLDTVLFGDKMYVYGASGERGWLREQTLTLAEKLSLDVVTQKGLNPEYPEGTTGDWSDHKPFKDLEIPWIYFESTNWDLKYLDGSYSEGESETEAFGEIMHTERDNMTFMDANFPGRMENRLYTYTTLLSELLEKIAPPVEISASTNLLSMSEVRDVNVEFDLGYAPNLSDLEWTLGGKAFDEWKSFNKADKKFNGESFIKFEKEPYLDGNVVKAVIKCDLPFGVTNLENRPYPRRIYPQLLGDYVLSVKDKAKGVQAQATFKLNAYDSYHKQTEIKPAVEKIIKEANEDRYIEYAPLGKSAEGRDIPFVMFARNKEDIDNYIEDTLPKMLNNPAEFIQNIKDDAAGNYKPVIWFNNIHSDEANGVDAQIDMLEKLSKEDSITFKRAIYNHSKAKLEEVTLDVQELLDNYIVLFCLNDNPDGRFYNSRETLSGFDPNRDVTYQTQIETATVFQAVAKWSPTIFCDYHGFVEEFLIEPCTPPHEPNFEYDLLMREALEHAHAIGKAGIANSKYEDYLIAKDYGGGQGWDDGAPMYAAVLSLLHGALGHTIEIPELNQESNNAFMYAGFGSLKYALENKEEIFTNQLEIYKRGVEGIDSREVDSWLVNGEGDVVGRPRGDNENFFPEYYVIPVDGQLQKNPLAAYEMVDFLIKNGIKVEKTNTSVKIGEITYPKGSFIVPMHQAKRGFANCVLYDGCDFSDFSQMYAEVTMCFPALRGFDKYEIRFEDAFDSKTDSISEVIIPSTELPSGVDQLVIKNTNNDAIKAINELLTENKLVYMTYSAGYGFRKGDFIVSKKDLESIKDKYLLEVIPFNGKATIKTLKQPKVSGIGDELIYILKNLGFNIVDSYDNADVIADEDSYSMTSSMKNAIQNGTSYIAIGGYGMYGLQTSGLLPGFEMGGFANYYEGILKADLDTDNVITGNYSNTDILYNNSNSWIEKVPETSKVLARISNTDDFYVAGWWPNHDEVKGKTYIIQDESSKSKITVFASHITNKAHNSHQFRLLANAIYDSMAGTTKVIGGSHHKKHKSSKTKEEKEKEEQVEKDQSTVKNKFNDVKASSWYSSAVNYVLEKGIMNGIDNNRFAPNVKTNRAMIVTMLYRLEGQPTAGKAAFTDVDASKWYGDSVAWASSNGVVTGYENNKFNPNTDLTREQLATILYRYAKYKQMDMSKKGNLNTFTDNSQVSSYANEAIAWAVGNGIITGKNENILDPKGSATRAEVAAMLQRFESINN